VLGYERKVVEAVSAATDPDVRDAVVAWVDGSLRAMPEVLRGGVALGSVVLGVWASLTGKEGDRLLAALESSPLPPVRQHLRLIRSLVLFGDIELSAAAS
jgi:hypothetical protein